MRMLHVTCVRVLVLIIWIAGSILGASLAVAQTPAPAPGDCPVDATHPDGTVAASAESPASTPAPATPRAEGANEVTSDTAAFASVLHACGIETEEVGPIEQPFLTADTGMVLRLSGPMLSRPAEIQVFEYQDAERASADVTQIDPDGSIPTIMITWIAPPHFFQDGHLIILYVGEDALVVELLTQLLGPPFAEG